MQNQPMPVSQDWKQVLDKHAYFYECRVGKTYALFDSFKQELTIWSDNKKYVCKKAVGKNVDWANKKLCKFLKVMPENGTFFEFVYVNTELVNHGNRICIVGDWTFEVSIGDTVATVETRHSWLVNVYTKDIQLDAVACELDDYLNYFVRKFLVSKNENPDDYKSMGVGVYSKTLTVFDEINKDYQEFVKDPVGSAKKIRERLSTPVPTSTELMNSAEYLAKYGVSLTQGLLLQKAEVKPGRVALASIQMLTLTHIDHVLLETPSVQFFQSMYDRVQVDNTSYKVRHLELNGEEGNNGSIQTVTYYSDGTFALS